MLKYEDLPRTLEFFSSRVNEDENEISRLPLPRQNKLVVLKSRDLVFRLEISKPRVFLEIDLTKKYLEEIDPRDLFFHTPRPREKHVLVF